MFCLSTSIIPQLRNWRSTLQENEPRFDMLAASSFHDAAVNNTAEFLLTFRTHQISLSVTVSDNVILQQETESIHVSIEPFLLHSQPVGLGLPFELLTSVVQHPADTLADAGDFANEVLPSLHFFCGFPMRRLRHDSSRQIT